MQCYLCKEEISPNHLGQHLKKCKKEKGLNISYNELKYNQFKYVYNVDFKKIIQREYIFNEKSILDISSEYNISYNHLLFLIEYFGFKRRTLKEEANSKKTREKYKNTCVKKYGVENISKLNEIKEKKRKTFIKNYGVDNIFKEKKFKDWIKENNFAWSSLTIEENKKRIEKQTISIKKFWNNLENKEYVESIKKENKEKYLKFLDNLSEEELKIYNKKKIQWWYDLTDEQKSELFSKRTRKFSGLETKISEALSLLNISHTRQKFIKNKSFDIHLMNTKILLEINGDYWHANPLMYDKKDKIKYPGKIVTAKDVWEYDLLKKQIAENEGYTVIYIWESEMNGDLKELVWQKLNLLRE
jgi:very-short-patch-repair endonuclease